VSAHRSDENEPMTNPMPQRIIPKTEGPIEFHPPVMPANKSNNKPMAARLNAMTAIRSVQGAVTIKANCEAKTGGADRRVCGSAHSL